MGLAQHLLPVASCLTADLFPEDLLLASVLLLALALAQSLILTLSLILLPVSY